MDKKLLRAQLLIEAADALEESVGRNDCIDRSTYSNKKDYIADNKFAQNIYER